jgi:amide synthase
MFDIERYLARIGTAGAVAASLTTLRELHKKHLMTLPYDSATNANRGIAIWKDVDIDVDAVFDDIVVNGRGGNCFELNGLFRKLLQEIGFKVSVLSAGIRQVDGSFGPELEHVFNRVDLDGASFLVDVGFVGPSYLEPLRITGAEQEQFGCCYRIVADGGYHTVQRKSQATDWTPVYRFRLLARDFTEWQEDITELTEFARELVSAGTVIRGRAFDGGQMILIGKRYLKVDWGYDEMRVLVDPAEHDRVVDMILRGACST